MISVKKMNFSELKDYGIELEKRCKEEHGSLLMVETDEILSYFKATPDDKYFVVNFKGRKEEIVEYLTYIKFPQCTFGRFIVYKANVESTLNELVEVQMNISNALFEEDLKPLLCWINNFNETCIEFELITKICDNLDMWGKLMYNFNI